MPASVSSLSLPSELLPALLDLSISGVVYYQPVRDAAGQVIDLTFAYLNPAAQRLLGLPAQPAATYLQQFPGTVASGLWDFHREALLAGGEPRQVRQNYQADGYDNYYQLAAQLVGEGLLVSFTDTGDHPRAPVELALRESQAREQAARAEAEAERQRLHEVLMRMPANIALLRGPEHTYDLVNPAYEQLFPARAMLGRTMREVIPELAGQGFYELFDRVYQTGEPYYKAEAEAWADFAGTGQPQRRYYRTTFEPLRDAQGRVTEVLNFAVDVTAQVEARQQVEQLNRELTAARAEAERERALLQALLTQAPVAIALFQGEQSQIASVNERMAALWGRTPGQVLGRPLLVAVPELEGQGFHEMIQGVRTTGQTYVGTEAPATILRDSKLVVRYYNFICQLIYDAQGEPLGVINVGTEVTEQLEARQRIEQLNQEAQAARAEAERQRGELWRVFEQAPIAIAVYRGANYTIELANPTVCRLWGRRAEDIIGKGLFEALPEVAGMGYEELLDGVMATGQPVVMHGMEAQHDRNGHRETVYWDFVYEPMYEPDGRIYGAMVVANEVTEQVLARRALEHLNRELESRVQERTRQLQEQQLLLSQILRQVPASIATMGGPEHRFTFFNEPYGALSAHRVRPGLTVAEVFPEVVEQGFIGLLDQVYATGQPFIGTDAPAQLHDAATGRPEQHYVDFIYQPLFDGQGQVQGILAFIVDVTERVRSRQQADTLQAAMLAVAQRQAQQRQDLLQLFERAPVAVALLREPDHRIDYFNSSFEQLFPGTQLGHTAAEAYPNPALPAMLARLDHVYESGERYQAAEVALATPATEALRYVTYTYQAYREQGRIVGVAVFVYDVTEQVLARRAVMQQQEAQQAELRRIFEQAPVAITILRGPELVIELANAAMSRLWGRPASHTVGRPHFEALPETRGQGFEELLHGVLASGQPAAVVEAPALLDRGRTGEPEQAYVNFSFQPLFDEHGTCTGVIAVGFEVTTQVLARQQVQALNDELQNTNLELHDTNARLTHTNADLDTFVYTASHDLKAPIANIEGLLNALRDYLPASAGPDAMVARLLGMMQDSVSRFQQTIGHLTDVSRLQYADPEPAQAQTLAAVVADVRLDLAPLLEATRARLLLDLDACPEVHFSPKNLRSIVYNLLSNALKYRDPERPLVVQVRAHCPAGLVVLEVQDNGLGLSETQQGRLFRLFQRLHTHVEGSGVGLYMLKRIVENAGGSIAVRSEPGVGSTFTVTLPRPKN